MANHPAVSIVISTYNQCHDLKKSVASVLAQTFENWELVLVDNASEDETQAWLNELRDDRIIKIRLEQNIRRPAAGNKGLAMARGEFILYLNHDHLLVETALQVHLDALVQNPDAIASMAGYTAFDQAGRREKTKIVRHPVKRNIWPEVMFGWMPASSGQCMVRLQPEKTANAWDEDLTYLALEEHALWLRLARLGPVVLLPDMLFEYPAKRGGRSHAQQLWKPLTRLRKHTAHKMAGKDREQALRLLSARAHFGSAAKHDSKARPVKALGFYLKTLQSAPELLKSPLTRPMILAPMRKYLLGTPVFLSWLQRFLSKLDIPMQADVADAKLSTKINNKMAKRGSDTVGFLDRSRMFGLEHELRWFWVKIFAAERWRQMAGRYKWIFILGCNNSGTTLLTRLLESHPAINGVPRGGRGATVVLLPPRRANVIRLWTDKIELFRLTEADQHPDTLRLFYDWVSAVRMASQPYILEKAPPDMVCARWFQAVFPNTYFIGLARNGYAVAEGMNRREGYSLDRCARHWNLANRIMLDDASHLERFMLVRYEELTRDPMARMQQVCAFLGIDSAPLQGEINKEWQVHNMDNSPAKIQDFNVRSLARLSKTDIEIINRHAGEMLGRFGYPMSGPKQKRSEIAVEEEV